MWKGPPIPKILVRVSVLFRPPGNLSLFTLDLGSRGQAAELASGETWGMRTFVPLYLSKECVQTIGFVHLKQV